MLVLIEFHSQVLGLHSLLKTIQWNLQINKGRIGIGITNGHRNNRRKLVLHFSLLLDPIILI